LAAVRPEILVGQHNVNDAKKFLSNKTTEARYLERSIDSWQAQVLADRNSTRSLPRLMIMILRLLA
jgi:hypothetical protein